MLLKFYSFPRYIPQSFRTASIFLLSSYRSITKKTHVCFTAGRWSEVFILEEWAWSSRGKQWRVWWCLVWQWRCKSCKRRSYIGFNPLHTQPFFFFLKINNTFCVQYTVFHIEFIDIVLSCLHTKFHMWFIRYRYKNKN